MKRPAFRACILFVWPTARRRIFCVGNLVRVCSLACPGHPGLRCSRFPVGKADIPVLVNQAAPHPLRLQFRKAGFQEAKQKSDVLRGAGVWGGVSRGTDVCLWYLMREWTIACPWSSGHPADNYWLKDCHHTPLLLSPLRNIDAVGVRASLLWQN